jgi:hypothetical protein
MEVGLMTEPLSVSVAIEGGFGAFPGLARPYTVDAPALPPDEADRLAKLVAESGFFELPDAPCDPSIPDARTYTITVTQGDYSRTLAVPEPLPSGVRELVDMVEHYRRAG